MSKRETPRLCMVCRERLAVHRCRICGRYVCSEDYDESRGICIICSSSLCSVCGEKLAVGSCEVCGRPVCEDCSIQLTPVVRLCRDCASRYQGTGDIENYARRVVEKLALHVSRLLPSASSNEARQTPPGLVRLDT